MRATRRTILAELRRAPQTVNDLAATLALTDNAVRVHLDSLEREGHVSYTGIGRPRGAPARLYDLAPGAELLFSKAYPPVLGALVAVMADRLGKGRSSSLLKATGRRLAESVGGRAAGSLKVRVNRAADVLRSLGGDITIARRARGYRLQSSGCPLGAVVAEQPECCKAVESMIEEIVGAPVQERCERGPRPRCAFLVGAGQRD